MTTEELKERFIELEQRCKSNTHRLDELEKLTNNVSELVTSIKLLAQKQDTSEEKLDTPTEKVDSITSKSGKRWDNIIDTAIGLVVSAIVTFILIKIGLQ